MQVIEDRIETFPSNPAFVKLGMIKEDDSQFIVFVNRLTGDTYIEQTIFNNIHIKNYGDINNNELIKVSDDNLWRKLVLFAHEKQIITNKKLTDICGSKAKVIALPSALK